MNNNIRKKRNELLKKSIGLRNLTMEEKNQNVDKTRKDQNRIHSKWEFYDKFIKAIEGVKK